MTFNLNHLSIWGEALSRKWKRLVSANYLLLSVGRLKWALAVVRLKTRLDESFTLADLLKLELTKDETFGGFFPGPGGIPREWDSHSGHSLWVPLSSTHASWFILKYPKVVSHPSIAMAQYSFTKGIRIFLVAICFRHFEVWMLMPQLPRTRVRTKTRSFKNIVSVD